MATVKELRAKAKGLFFNGYSKINKAELEKLISDYEASEEAFRDIDPSIHAPEATTQPEQPQPTQPIIPDEILTVYNWERLLKDCITYEDFRRILNTGTMKALVEIASNFKNFNQPTRHQKCKSWYVNGIADIISFRESEAMQAILSIKPKCSLIGLSLKDQKKAIAQCATEEEIIALLWTLPDWKAIEDLGFALKLIAYPHLVVSLANAERMKYNVASSLAASIWREREKEKDRTEFLTSQPEGLLGMFTFSYTENKEKKSVVLSVEKKDTRDFQDNLKIYMGNVYLDIKDSKGKTIAHYVPYLDRFDFSRDIDWLFPSYRNWTRAILFMEQFRKVVPDYLRKMNLLNKEGELISDGAETFRVLFYQHWRISRNKEDFSMPDNPFSEGNDENNPLTWKDTPYRDKALAVYHGILYYQIEAEDAQQDKTKARSKYTVSKIETLKKKLHALYIKSQEQPSAPQPEVVAVQDVTPEVIRVGFSQPESVVEQDTTEAPTIEATPATEAWQEHSCDHCKPEKHLWSKEQFYRGMCLIFDCENNPDYRYKSLTAYLLDTYTLTELWKLARYFALNVPKIELNSKNRTLQKSIQIAYLLADMLFEMDHVFTATYIVINPPELPNELKGKLSTIRQEMYDRNVHKQPEQPATVEESSPTTQPATVKQAPKVKASAPKPKPRKTRRKYDDTRTLSLGFDEDSPAEISSQVATSKPVSNTQKSTAGNQSSSKSSTTKRRRNTRRKYDESQQVLICFEPEIFSGNLDQEQAA